MCRQPIQLQSFQIGDNWHTFFILLENIERKNDYTALDRLEHYLEEHAFAIAPSSTSRAHHHCWKGGWVQHALGVYIRMVRRNHNHTHPSIVKVALLHDICKLEEFYIDNTGQLQKRNISHRGHGALSIKILHDLGYELTPEERRAIRWHMGGHHAHTPEEKKEVLLTKREWLYKLVHAADREDAADDHHLRAAGELILRQFDTYANFHRVNRQE